MQGFSCQLKKVSDQFKLYIVLFSTAQQHEPPGSSLFHWPSAIKTTRLAVGKYQALCQCTLVHLTDDKFLSKDSPIKTRQMGTFWSKKLVLVWSHIRPRLAVVQRLKPGSTSKVLVPRQPDCRHAAWSVLLFVHYQHEAVTMQI